MRHPLLMVASAAFGLLFSSSAFAQFGGQPGGGMGPGMGPGPGGAGDDTKTEGPAEEAPEEEQGPADLAPLGSYAGQSRRASQVLELDGDFRFRSDFFHKLHLDQTYLGTSNSLDRRPPPFPFAFDCGTEDRKKCESKNIGGANIRLRLDPTINVTDQVRVMAQVDVFDNTILGSTPNSVFDLRRTSDRNDFAQAGIVSTSQDPPEVGQNSLVSSIRAKRAWGEIDSEFGSLQFGRMPWHFGRGISYNNGNCQDCDYGTTVDRLMARTQLYGHQLALSWDFGSQGVNTNMLNLGLRDPSGPAVDLGQNDDVLQLMFAVTKLDDERQFYDRATLGEVMFNYGAQFVYREQGKAVYNLPTTGNTTTSATRPITREDLTVHVNVDAKIVLPSLWMKLGWKSLTIEAEATGAFGRIGKAGPLAIDPEVKLDVRQLGWVLSTELRLAKNALSLGFETGGASGDQAEDPRQYLNARWRFVPQPLGDGSITDFKFSPDYHVDEILFRRILGTVSNAAYAKPKLVYWLDLAEQRQIGLSAAGIYSMALVPVSTPGNASPFGVEMNLGVNYRNPADGVYGGITWAVLWPMAALDRPQGSNANRPLWSEEQDATSAQALRLFLGIKF
ncbi:MAG TPA: TIGR04551 family protein [Polyangia bacterium]